MKYIYFVQNVKKVDIKILFYLKHCIICTKSLHLLLNKKQQK